MKKNISVITLLIIFLLSCQKKNLSEKDSLQILEQLPEIKRALTQDRAENGPRIVVRQDKDQTVPSGLDEFYVGESHETHTTILDRYAVDRKTGEIYIYDVEEAEFVPLEQWREKNKSHVEEQQNR